MSKLIVSLHSDGNGNSMVEETQYSEVWTVELPQIHQTSLTVSSVYLKSAINPDQFKIM
jgi:hypothetical protein